MRDAEEGQVLRRFQSDPTIAACVAAPELQLQACLQVAAWQLVRLGPGAAFTLTLPGAAVAAAEGTPSSSSGAAELSGSIEELGELILALNALVGTVPAASSSSSSQSEWAPPAGRIRVRRCAAGGGGALGWLLGRRQAADAAAGAAYELAWSPQQPPAASSGQAVQAAQQGVVRLSQRQLNALLDCLDAFSLQHPGVARLPPLEPLAAPAPGWSQRLGSWLAGGGGSSSGTAAAASEGTAA